MAPVVPFIPLIAAGVTTVGGIITGRMAQKSNEQMIDNQNQQYAQVAGMAEQMVNQVQRANYNEMANQDVNKALSDVFGVMAQRGMGRSTAGLTAAADASQQIRTTYGRQYLSDRQSALSSAASVLSGVAGAPRLGFTNNPYAGMQAGMGQLGQLAGYYQQNGYPWDKPAGSGSGSSWGGVSYGGGSGLGQSTGYYGGSIGSRYQYP